MKKFLLACALALPVALLANHRASAWCSFNFSGGFNISFQSSWCGFGCGSVCPADCCPANCGGYPGYAGYPGYDGAYGGYGLPADAVPAQPGSSFPPAPKPVDNAKKTSYLGTGGNGYQPVGYSYGYQAGSYGYPSAGYYQYSAGGSFQAPSYWYGR